MKATWAISSDFSSLCLARRASMALMSSARSASVTLPLASLSLVWMPSTMVCISFWTGVKAGLVLAGADEVAAGVAVWGGALAWINRARAPTAPTHPNGLVGFL